MITVRVYDPALNYIGTLHSRRQPSFQVQLGKFGEGVGSFQLSADAPELTTHPGILDYDNVVVMYDNTTDHYEPWILQKKSRGRVSAGEYAGDVITVSGKGALDLLRDGVVLSEGWTVDSPAKTGSRSTSFASREGDWYNEADWVLPDSVPWTEETSARRRSPRGWPDPDASWIWFLSASDPATPAGYCYARTVIHMSGPEHVSLFTSADNAYDMWVDGEPATSGSSWGRFERADFDWLEGDHVVAIRGYNLEFDGPNPAGILFSAWTSSASSSKRLNLLRNSNVADWLVYGGEGAPGWDPGDVLKTFIDEAVARGVNSAFASIVCDWTPSADTDGVAWEADQRVNRKFSIGTEILNVARQLAESSCDVRMVWDQSKPPAERLRLQLFKHQGVDRSLGVNNPSGRPVVLREGLNLLEAEFDGDSSGRKTALIIKTDLGWVEEVSAVYGAIRKESYASIGSSEDLAMAIAVAAAAFEKVGAPEESIRTKAIPVTDRVPFKDFQVGDEVLAPDAEGAFIKNRVVAVTIGEDENGRTTFSPELSNIPFNRVVRATRWLQSMLDGALGGRLLNASPATLPVLRKPTGANVIDVPFSFAGPLEVSTSPEYTPRDDALLVELLVLLTTAGSTATEVDYIKNGALVSTIEVPAGSHGVTLDVNDFYEGNVDKMQVALSAAGSGADTLTVQARFN